ncbi:AcfC-like protein [Anopheles sinensis]|uniref:AcfC-like protein n=1 Tax=Anopheles sinensis TaxID=74873 RepID=A0A084WE51_ANOSI|nr:AcfC-like protein [Anopheles sinensis]
MISTTSSKQQQQPHQRINERTAKLYKAALGNNIKYLYELVARPTPQAFSRMLDSDFGRAFFLRLLRSCIAIN